MKGFLLLLFSFLTFIAIGQVQDPNSPGFDLGTVLPDSNAQQETQGEEGVQQAVAKPYERIKLYTDSITNLISYIGVAEVMDSNNDSLYARAKAWATKAFGSGSGKALFEVDKKGLKLVINGWLPAYAYGNKYNKRTVGKYYFKMTVWLKEERYKYQITNLVHESQKSNEGNTVRNYFEFYYTSPNNIKGNDQLLRFADKDINLMIEQFKKAMLAPPDINEEDW